MPMLHSPPDEGRCPLGGKWICLVVHKVTGEIVSVDNKYPPAFVYPSIGIVETYEAPPKED